MIKGVRGQRQADAVPLEERLRQRDGAGYAELCVTTNFTFLTGASHPEELVLRAAELGLEAIAITDRNTLAGVVRAYSALKTLREEATQTLRVRSSHQVDSCSRQEVGQPQDLHPPQMPRLPKLIVGSRLVLRDCPVEWMALPTDRAAYHRLSRLLTLGKRRAEKAECHLDLQDLEAGCQGMILIALPPADLDLAQAPVRRLARRFPGAVFLGAPPRYDGSDQAWFDACAAMAQRCSTPMVAVGDVLMHHGKRRQLADVLTCLREGITIDQIGTKALPNSERRLKGASDMARLYRRHPAALKRSLEIAARCGFDLSELSYEYPDEMSEGETPQARLERLAREGVKRRYPNGASERVHQLMQKELALIDELKYAPYFLTVRDIVQEARARGILCQGRGSAANSILCYLLGITDVSPDMIGMVFERFISRHRGEPPDIDVDFEHERREEVIQWIYKKYGRHRAGLCATVIHFRTRAAIREVGKVMGLSQDVTARLSGDIWGMSNAGVDMDRVRALGLDPTDLRLAQTLKLIGEVIGFPRHLSQHVGGFIITRGRLDELCPIENAAMDDRTVIEWDKDDIDTLGILKVDILSLGMLTCLRKSFDLLEQHEKMRLSLDTVPQEDHTTYEMLQRADAVGVFQVESRAQMNFLPRMKPATFYDLVIEVAIVRPGPIQGGMVKPYIRRRQGLEVPKPFGPALSEVTRKTLGVPLFQEQAMQIAVVGAGFAMLTYVSSWLKCHHPAIFACALLNSQPMGFYAPAQIVRDVRDHSVEVRPVCVNHSEWDNILERRADGALALRLGFRQIKGFRAEDAGWIRAARGNGYQDPESVWLRAGVAPSVLERLAEADAFIGMGLTRRDALWQVRAIRAPAPLPLFADPLDGEGIREPQVDLPNMHLGEEVVEDYISLRLTLRAHPMELLRPTISGLTPHDRLPVAPLKRTSVCGLVITRQRPGTASGVIFLTLEDETGVSNVVGRLLRVTGRLEREGIVVHLIADQIEDLSHRLSDLGHPLDDAVGITQPQADDAPRTYRKTAAHHPREQAKRLFPSRDFH